MGTSLQKMGWRLLIGVAGLYAVLATLVAFAPAIAAGWRVTRPAAGHGNISVSINQSLILRVDMTATHSSPWSGSVNLPVVALCTFGPLVILWIIAIVRSRRGDAIIRS